MRAAPLPILTAAVACVACLLGCASQRPEPPASWDGLERRDVKGLDTVYVRPDVQFPPYRKVMLDPVQVSFSKSWDPNATRDISRRLDAGDLQKIKDGLADIFRQSFSDELAKGGYALTDAPEDDTIRVSAAIVDLYINAPDVMTAGRSRTYTTDAGSMTLVMEVRDAPTGQLLARVIDARRAGSGTYMQWTNAVTNRADARRIVDVWARKLREGLDRVNGRAS